MATIKHKSQYSTEAKPYPLDYELPSGVTLSSITVTHEPPSGDAASVTSDVTSAADGTGNVYVPKGLIVGVHDVHCVAVTSNAKVAPEILLVITVDR